MWRERRGNADDEGRTNNSAKLRVIMRNLAKKQPALLLGRVARYGESCLLGLIGTGPVRVRSVRPSVRPLVTTMTAD